MLYFHEVNSLVDFIENSSECLDFKKWNKRFEFTILKISKSMTLKIYIYIYLQ
jgi:hypothetical protein